MTALADAQDPSVVTPGDVVTPNDVRPMTGAQYLESLRDDREVYVYGERVKDVTSHPAFRNSTRGSTKRELVILIKPTIIQSDRDQERDIQETRDRLQGYGGSGGAPAK